MDHQELSINQKIKIAMETIICSKMKDNYDDTLIEKFCSFLKEFDSVLLEKLILEENLFDLIDDHLQLFINDDEKIVAGIDDIVIAFRISKSLLDRQNIFQLYLQSSQQNLTKLLLKIFTETQKTIQILLKFNLLEFLNRIYQHEAGKTWISKHLLCANNCSLFLDKVFHHKNKETIYERNEAIKLLANIINLAQESRKMWVKDILRKKFTQANDNWSKILPKIIPLLSDSKKFIEEYEIIAVVQNSLQNINFQTSDPSSFKDWGALLSTLVRSTSEQSTASLWNLIDSFLLKLKTETTDCFQYSWILYCLIEGNHQIQIDLVTKLFSFFQRYIQLLQKQYFMKISDHKSSLHPNEEIMLAQTIEKYSIYQFQRALVQQFSQIESKFWSNYLDQTLEIIQDLLDLATKMDLGGDKKNLNLMLKFCENCTTEYTYQKSRTIPKLYLKLYQESNLGVRKCVLKSITTIFRRTELFAFDEILDLLLEHLQKIQSTIDCDDEDDYDLAEMIVELIFEIIFITKELSANDMSRKLAPFLSVEYCMLKKEDLESCCKANILSTMLMIYYCRDNLTGNEFLSEDLFINTIFNSNLSQQDFLSICPFEALDFRQQLFTNIKHILGKFRFGCNLNHSKLLLNFVCRNCAQESDTELQLIQFDVIDLILCSQSESFALKTDTELLPTLCSIWKEAEKPGSLVPALIKNRVQQCLLKHVPKLNQEDLRQTLMKTFSPLDSPYQCLMEFSNSIANSEGNGEKYGNQEPETGVLDDIVFTSTLLQEEIVMDCY